MTFHAYALPKGAPQKQVWFAVCDVCHKTHIGPLPNAPRFDQQTVAESAGWRYQREHPMDTCPNCAGTSVPADTQHRTPTTAEVRAAIAAFTVMPPGQRAITVEQFDLWLVGTIGGQKWNDLLEQSHREHDKAMAQLRKELASDDL
jgi:hypothetical protein